jgi:hypothetical protein
MAPLSSGAEGAAAESTLEMGVEPLVAGSSAKVPTGASEAPVGTAEALVGAAEAPVGAVEVSPRTFEETEVGLLQPEVSNIPLRALSISQHSGSSVDFFFAIRVSPLVLARAPVKALKLRTSLGTGCRLERTLWAATGTVAVIEPTTRTTTAVAAQVPATHDPHQGCGQARTDSNSA